jgi:hypothetical protein
MTPVLLALASAGALAVATVLGHRAAATTADAAAREPRRRALPRSAGRLLRHPAFLAAQVAGAVGFALHAAALASGLVVVVQPLLCTGLVMALALGAVLDRRHPGRPLPRPRQWLAAVLVVVGLALFLVTAAPTAGSGQAGGPALPLAVAGVTALSGVIALGVVRGWIRSAALALGAVAGIAFGLMGVLMKVVAGLPVADWPTSWATYALAGVGIGGTVLAQWSYGAGPLVQSQPALTALEPVVALALAGPVFSERLAAGAAAHTGQLAGIALMVVGVVEVARHTAVAAVIPRATGQSVGSP